MDIPGDRTPELPPLRVRSTPVKRLDKMVSLAEDIIASENLLSTVPLLDPRIELEFERRRFDLAFNLVGQYQTFMHTRAGLNPDPVSDLPPDRFHFDVVTI